MGIKEKLAIYENGFKTFHIDTVIHEKCTTLGSYIAHEILILKMNNEVNNTSILMFSG